MKRKEFIKLLREYIAEGWYSDWSRTAGLVGGGLSAQQAATGIDMPPQGLGYEKGNDELDEEEKESTTVGSDGEGRSNPIRRRDQ